LHFKTNLQKSSFSENENSNNPNFQKEQNSWEYIRTATLKKDIYFVKIQSKKCDARKKSVFKEKLAGK
jgi:hypothetical protein